jgi:3-oxoacyl-[acyl-carrier-protein] synthase III
MRIFRPADYGRPVRLAGTGRYLPERVVDNAALAEMGAPLTPDEVVRLCGVESRRWAADGQATSDLAIAAGRAALTRSGLRDESISRVLVGTVSPDYMSPACACLVQNGLGLPPVPAMDLTAACSGFLYALDVAARAVVTGDDAVLAVAADVRSRFVDLSDRGTCALFGDGAGAAVVVPGDDPRTGLVAIGLTADGSGAHSVYVPAGGSRRPASAESVAARAHTIQMKSGPAVYLAAVEGMLGTAAALLEAEGLSFEDIRWVVPHQPNKRILDRMGRLGGIPEGRIYKNIQRVGNISGATVAVALDEILSAGQAEVGDKLLLLAAGAGYTAGAALLVVDAALLARY